MKKLLLLIPCLGLALNAGAYSNLDVSLLRIMPNSDSAVENDLGYGSELEDDFGLSVEWRTDSLYDTGFTYGLEYIYWGTDAELSGSLSAGEAITLNAELGAPGFFTAGQYSVKEEYAVHNLLLNIAYDIVVSDQVTAFVGAGAGVALAEGELTLSGPSFSETYDDSSVVFVYQLEAGLRYNLSDDWTLNGGVRYIGYSDTEFNYAGIDFSPEGLDAVALDLGLSYMF